MKLDASQEFPGLRHGDSVRLIVGTSNHGHDHANQTSISPLTFQPPIRHIRRLVVADSEDESPKFTPRLGVARRIP